LQINRKDALPSLGLEHDGARILVRADEPDHLSWLGRFLIPQFRRVDESVCEYEVRLSVAPERYARLLARGAAGGRLDVFALESGAVELPLWNAESDDTTVYDEGFHVFCSLGPDARTVLIVTPEADGLALFFLMRVVRELAMNTARGNGRLFLHAAALELGDRGVIIAGTKAAGKTTLLMSLLRHRGARYVSNDRVLVDTARDPAMVRGMPTIITIRPGTLAVLPTLRDRLLAGGDELRLSFADAANRFPALDDERVFLTPAQLCSLIGVSALAEVEACSLVFPRVTSAVDTWRLEPLTSAATAQRLREVLFGGHVRKGSDLFLGPAAPDEATIARLIAELASRVRSFECLLGRGAHADDHARRLLERVVE
jgi:hypothetical protein